ncbi:MAG: hypothetical protein OEX19_13870, partial [Gammaproteobacteria bacterium]|nr:hypothetical protein [Gammaproteobacteria bacterium]
FIYGGISTVLIILLIALVTSGSLSSDMVGILAILTVIVLPIVISVFIGKKEKQKQQTDAE